MKLLSRLLPLVLACGCAAQEFHPNIPKAWDDKEVEGFEVQLAQRDRSPRYMSSAEYYKLQVHQIYRSYPAYAKGMEPPGYMDWLKQQEPQIVFDPSKLRTKEDWIAAGKTVFESEIRFFPAPEQPAPGRFPFRAQTKTVSSLFTGPGSVTSSARKVSWKGASMLALDVTFALCRTAPGSRAHRELSMSRPPRR